MGIKKILKAMLEKDPTFTIGKVRQCLAEIDRKAYVSARYEAVYDIIDKYLRVFKVAKEHLEEKIKVERHVFNIDFSNIYTYLNPSNAFRPNELISVNNIGSIYTMLDSKYAKEYCMLPPTIWELMNKLKVTRDILDQNSNIDAVNRIPAMELFHDTLNKWDGTDSDALSGKVMHQYNSMKPFSDILLLVDENKLSKRLQHNHKNIREMLSNLTRPIDAFVDDIENVKINEPIYKRALNNLSWRRPWLTINNQIDAANVAITYDLTEKCAAEDKKQKTVYRFLSQSRQTSDAFRNIDCHDVFLSCCPQFVSTLILAETDQIVAGGTTSQIAYFNESIPRLEEIRRQFNELKNPQRFKHVCLDPQYLEDKTLLMKEVLEPIFKHTNDLTKFKKQIYPSVLAEIMDINSGENVKYKDHCFKSDAKYLKQIFADQKRYKALIEEASGIIYDDLKDTYKDLCKYVDGKYGDKFLTPEMRGLLNELNKGM
jgi:hypothetical protein